MKVFAQSDIQSNYKNDPKNDAKWNQNKVNDAKRNDTKFFASGGKYNDTKYNYPKYKFVHFILIFMIPFSNYNSIQSYPC